MVEKSGPFGFWLPHGIPGGEKTEIFDYVDLKCVVPPNRIVETFNPCYGLVGEELYLEHEKGASRGPDPEHRPPPPLQWTHHGRHKESYAVRKMKSLPYELKRKRPYIKKRQRIDKQSTRKEAKLAALKDKVCAKMKVRVKIDSEEQEINKGEGKKGENEAKEEEKSNKIEEEKAEEDE
ncbi:MAG: hypothetical protein Q9166_005655 [cf. Caloplaca sp. 2 TL-2023]